MAKKKKSSEIVNGISLGANSEMFGRYSEAGKQFKIAHDGINNEIGKKLHQGLKGISKSKVNPAYQNQNINQQAGYSAEVLDTAKQNAENIKKGDSSRVSRTDDLGRVNDTKSDQVTVDKYGNAIKNSEVQMKVLKNADSFLTKVNGKEYSSHYPDGKFRVPSDQYDSIKEGLKQKIAKLEEQQLTPEKQQQLDYLKKVDKNLKKSTVSKNEATKARTNPKMVTEKEILKTSHEAGVEAAKNGAAIGGSISIITNTRAVLNNEKEVKEAIEDITIDTAKSGATSYVTGFANTALASVMKNSSKEIMRTLGKANAPAYIIQAATTTVKSLARLCKEEITVDEFFMEIGKSGTTLLASAKGAVIGQLIIPIPVVGALVGGLVSTLICGTLYDYTIGMKALNAEIDAFCGQLGEEITFLKEYQARLMQLDLDKFQKDTNDYGSFANYISENYDERGFNAMLKVTYDYVGIPCPWGSGSLNDFMNNKNGVLTYS